jgi:Holliday junction resolvase-like predicted endonuclease
MAQIRKRLLSLPCIGKSAAHPEYLFQLTTREVIGKLACDKLLDGYIEKMWPKRLIKKELRRCLDEPLNLAAVYDLARAAIAVRDLPDRIRYSLAKKQSRHLLSRLDKAQERHERGKILEDLVAAIFGSHSGALVIEQRFSTRDEEIDLIIKNSFGDPFWIGLSSLLFVECKNWTKKVGPQAIRDFEVKMRNHRPLVKIGFFVGPGGFTKGCSRELLRLSRDETVVVLVTLTDIEAFITGSTGLPDWLGRMIMRLA